MSILHILAVPIPALQSPPLLSNMPHESLKVNKQAYETLIFYSMNNLHGIQSNSAGKF